MKYLIVLITLFFSIESFASIGTITALKGSATIDRNQLITPVKIGSAIDTTDIIKTGDKTLLQIIFSDKTAVTLGANTQFSVQSYKFGTAENSKAEFSLSKGFFKSVSGKIGKLAPQRFKIKTPTATIGIRGTTYSIQANQDKTTLKTFKGETYLVDNISGISYSVVQNKQLVFNNITKAAKISTLKASEVVIISQATTKSESSEKESTETSKDSDETTKDSSSETTEASNDSVGTIEDSSSEASIEDPSTVINPTNKTTEIIVDDSPYSSYGYWLNSSTGEVSGLQVEGSPATLPTVLDVVIDNPVSTATAKYEGSLVAFDENNVGGTGSIKINIDFDGGANAVDGKLNYTVDETHWKTSFDGSVNNTGMTINSFTPDSGSGVSGINGQLNGQFYGSNAEDMAGTFDLTGTVDKTGLRTTSTGAYSATGDGIK